MFNNCVNARISISISNGAMFNHQSLPAGHSPSRAPGQSSSDAVRPQFPQSAGSTRGRQRNTREQVSSQHHYCHH